MSVFHLIATSCSYYFLAITITITRPELSTIKILNHMKLSLTAHASMRHRLTNFGKIRNSVCRLRLQFHQWTGLSRRVKHLLLLKQPYMAFLAGTFFVQYVDVLTFCIKKGDERIYEETVEKNIQWNPLQSGLFVWFYPRILVHFYF